MGTINSDVTAGNSVVNPNGDPYPKIKTETFALFGGINAKVSQYVNQPQELRDLLNMDFFFPGALNKRPGSTLYSGATVTGEVTSGIEFARLNGSSYVVAAANTNLYTVTPGGGFNAVVTGLANGQNFGFAIMADRLFCGNGNTYFKFDGTNNYLYSLPQGITGTWGVTAVTGGSLTSGITTTFMAAYGYVNERGFAGPTSNAVSITLDGVTNNSFKYYGITQPPGNYGITAIQLWRSVGGGVNLFGTTLLASGSTSVTDTGFALGTSLAIPHLFMTMAPRYMALYNNQLFMAGFSQFPSRVYWSEIGEPEGIQPTYYNDFNTNDGDYITGIKVYSGRLVVGKTKSLYQLNGTDPTNFAVQQISDQYGSLSNTAMVVFNNLLWMIDSKGIVQYDGANVGIESTNVEPLWLQMNYASAINQATGAHYKQLGQVWFSFPSLGATVNNQIVVYDYNQNAWARHAGVMPACFFVAQGDQPIRTLFYGAYNGQLGYFGQSYMSDNGNAFTCVPFSLWLAPGGQTTESMYRRLWIDVDPILGITQNISVQIYANYVTSSIAYTGTVPATTFQSRVDFGISARTIACQFAYSSATLPFKLNAYTLESRYQRSV